jgi:hypothetical protein
MPGLFCVSWGVRKVRITRADGLVDIFDAALLAKVKPGTLRQWSSRGVQCPGCRRKDPACRICKGAGKIKLAKAGLDENGRSLFDPAAVQVFEHATRERARRVIYQRVA